MNNNEFDKFAQMHQGISSTTLNRYRTELFSIIAQHSGQALRESRCRRRTQLLDDRPGGAGVRDGGSDFNEEKVNAI